MAEMKKMLALRTDKWFAMQPKAEGETDAADRIDLAGVIGGSFWDDGVTLAGFLAEAKTLTAPKLEVHISSPGGSVSDGVAIYNYLAGLRAKGTQVTTVVDGLAASIASVIAMAGDRIVMGAASMMMIHRPWAMVCGNAGEISTAALDLAKVGDSLARIYAARSGLTIDEVRAIMAGPEDGDGTLLSAEECKEKGLCDEITENKLRAAACAGAAIWGLEEDPEKPEEPEEKPEEPEAKPEEPEAEEEPEAKPEEPAEEPEEKPEEPAAKPEEAPAEPEKPEEAPEEEPEEEPEEDPERIVKLENEVKDLRGRLDKLLRNGLAPHKTEEVSARTWEEALAVCDNDYAAARKRFPAAFHAYLKKYNS